jgi:hypothetical protein
MEIKAYYMDIKVGDLVYIRPEVMEKAKIEREYHGISYKSLCLLNKNGAVVEQVKYSSCRIKCSGIHYGYNLETKDLIKDDIKEKLEAILG